MGGEIIMTFNYGWYDVEKC